MATAQPMYHMTPVTVTKVNNLPSCMYKMKNIYTGSIPQADQAGSNLIKSTEILSLVSRQDGIIGRLEELSRNVESLLLATSTTPTRSQCSQSINKTFPKEIVISCNPSESPKALLQLITEFKRMGNILCAYHIHSSVKDTPCLDLTQLGFEADLTAVTRRDKDMVITWIWKDCEDCELMVSPLRQVKIINEANICRYLLRLRGAFPDDAVAATVWDQWFDLSTSVVKGSNASKSESVAKMSKQLGKSSFITGDLVRFVDLIVWSAYTRAVTSGKWLNDSVLKQWSTAVKAKFLV